MFTSCSLHLSIVGCFTLRQIRIRGKTMTRVYTFMAWKCGLGKLRSLCVCIMCVKINNEELFFNVYSRWKINITLFMDRLGRDA